MRAGELRHRAEIVELNADLLPTVIGSAWVGVIAKEAADVPMPSGLRNPAKIDVRARYTSKLTGGRYLRLGQRLLHITSARDPLGNKAELRISADELIGQPAQYLPAGGTAVACRVHLTHQAPWFDEEGTVTGYKTKAEVAVIEVGRPEQGDQIQIGDDTYSIIGYANDTDDGVVRGLWLEREA